MSKKEKEGGPFTSMKDKNRGNEKEGGRDRGVRNEEGGGKKKKEGRLFFSPG